LAHRRGVRPDIVVSHDFRGCSAAIKDALIAGLMAAGMRVKDMGLALSPMACFAGSRSIAPASP
jgi:phosphomannomutase / phosphoglucomutase